MFISKALKITLQQSRFLIMAAIIAIAAVVYFDAFSFGYVNWDDDENIRANPRFTEFTGDNILYHFDHSRYKALAIWSFMAQYQILGPEAESYHVVNLILHLINVVLVFLFVSRLVPKNRFAPLITAALFALHPAFIEPVVWITGRKDLLFVLFSLLSFLAYIRFISDSSGIKKYLFLAIAVLCAYFASLAKIQAVALPVVFFVLDWFFGRKITLYTVLEKTATLFILFDLFILTSLLACIGIVIYYRRNIIQVIGKNIVTKIAAIIIFWSVLLLLWYFPKTYMPFNTDIAFYKSINGDLILFLIFTFPFAVFYRKKIINWFSRIRYKRAVVKWFLIFFILILVIVFFIFKLEYILRFFNGFFQQQPSDENFYNLWERVLLLSGSMIYYLKRFVLLQGLDPMIPYPQREPGGSLPAYLFTELIAVAVITLIVGFVLIRYFRKSKPILFGAAFFLINISLVLHIIPIEGRILVGDRYTYLSFVGLFMLVGLLSDYIVAKKKGALVAGVFGLILIVMGYTTYREKAVWHSSVSLWQKALAVNPKNHFAMYSLALAYFSEEKNPQTAESFLNQAIALKHDFMYYNNRGRVRYAMGDMRGALSDFDISIDIDSTNFASFNNRGAVRQQFCDFEGALIDYSEAIRLLPEYTEAINNRRKVLDLMYMDSILFSESISAEVTRPRMTDFILMISEKLIKTEQNDKAVVYLEAGIKLFENEARFYEKLGVIYHLKNQFAEAKKYYDAGLLQVPDDKSLLLGRGLLYIQTGDTLKACVDLQVAAQKGDPDAQNLLNQFCR